MFIYEYDFENLVNKFVTKIIFKALDIFVITAILSQIPHRFIVISIKFPYTFKYQTLLSLNTSTFRQFEYIKQTVGIIKKNGNCI